MKRLLNSGVAILALLLPTAAFANLGPTTVNLSNGETLSLDTGATSGSGDILFTGTGISFKNSATGVDITASTGGGGFSGQSGFTELTGAEGSTFFSSFSGFLSANSIVLTTSNVNDIIVVKTNGGNDSVILVNSVSSSSLGITYFTFETVGPTITAVLNNYGLIPAGFPNSGIAPSTLFIIKGSGLADPNAQAVLQDSTAAGGLPKTLNGASVSVKVGSTTVTPAFYYAIASQLALVLPSGTPTGSAQLTVTYNGTPSSAFNFTVVKSAPGIAASSGTGSGLAHAQDLNYNYYTYTNSITPPATIRLIASGLGADDNSARDTMYVTPNPTTDAIPALAAVYVGGVEASIFYQGPEGYPGLDEIDVTIPANAPTGCFVSIVGVTTAGVPTNFLSIPIGAGVCQDSLGFSGTTLTQLGTQQTVNSGSVIMSQSTGPSQNGGTTTLTEALADFQSYTGGTYYYEGGGEVSIGGCIVSEQLSGTASLFKTSPLSAGMITVTSPNPGFQPVPLVALGTFDPGFYATIDTSSGTSTLPAGFLTDAGGTFTFNATAGSQVGSFTTQINFPNPLLNWTNQSAAATVVRANGQLVTWTGGAAGTYVIISGTSSNGNASASFTCLSPVAPGSFTVPSYVLLTLPNGSGTLGVGNETIPTSFTATGLDYAAAIGYVSYSVNSTYQ